MKLFKLLFLVLVIFSCEPEEITEEDCRCEKITYEIVQESVIGANGLPQILFFENEMGRINVECQDEQSEVDNGDGTFYKIECE